MECPQCSSRRIRRDMPPLGGYALVGAGLLLIVIGGLLSAQVLIPELAGERGRMLMIGIACVVFGGFKLFSHPFRWCAACGARFREPVAALRSAPARESSCSKDAAGGASESSSKLNPMQPIEPLLACLRFKNPAQRMQAAQTLHRLTGQSFGEDADAWSAWWAENRESFEASRRGDSTPTQVDS